MNKKKKRVVIKVGTALTTMKDGRLNLPFLANLTEEISHLPEEEFEIMLVSSGAVAAGRRVLFRAAHHLENRQALSCLGQPILMEYYRDFFRIHDRYTGQCLFTSRDFDDADARRIMTNVLNELLRNNIMPILNENDAASDIEMRYGDNDQLASHLAVLTDADLLVLMSDVPGFYDKDPQKDPDAKLIPRVESITPEIQKMAGEKISEHSMGGMRSKITAVKRSVEAGIPVYLIHGREPGLLTKILLEGKEEGTFFAAQKE